MSLIACCILALTPIAPLAVPSSTSWHSLGPDVQTATRRMVLGLSKDTASVEEDIRQGDDACQTELLPRPRRALQACHADFCLLLRVLWCRVLTLTCAGADRDAPDARAERAQPPDAADPDRKRRQPRNPGMGSVPPRAARPGRPYGVQVRCGAMLLLYPACHQRRRVEAGLGLIVTGRATCVTPCCCDIWTGATGAARLRLIASGHQPPGEFRKQMHGCQPLFNGGLQHDAPCAGAGAPATCSCRLG